ncbi:unnamed protein product, partial [Brassica oleracea]
NTKISYSSLSTWLILGFFSPIWVGCEFDHDASDHDISLIISFCYLHISLLLISLLSPQLS